MERHVPAAAANTAPRWQPLSRNERRVIGTLVEKAKTTPQQYPLSLNALVTGCNQKNNRAPVMELDEEHVDNALERLRLMGACVEVNADSRTPRYRHTMYEWLGCDKVELAVMTELLLRGDQTVGELRGRAARMDPIEDLAALRPILAALATKKLIVYLTLPGRGCIVTHNLYEPQEMDKLREKYGTPAGGFAGDEEESAGDDAPRPVRPAAVAEKVTSEPSKPTAATPPTGNSPPANLAQNELHNMRNDITNLQQELLEMRSELEQKLGDLRRDIEDIRQQIGGL